MIDALARYLALLSSKRVGVGEIAVCIDKSRVYGAGVLQGLADYLEVHGPWSVLVESFSNGELPWHRLEHWKGHGILTLLCTKQSVKQIAELGIPAVDLCAGLEPEEYAEFGIPCVTSDQQAIGKLAAEHLIENGYKHLAFSGFCHLNWVEDRWRGFSEAANNLAYDRHTYLMPPSQSGEFSRDLAAALHRASSGATSCEPSSARTPSVKNLNAIFAGTR